MYLDFLYKIVQGVLKRSLHEYVRICLPVYFVLLSASVRFVFLGVRARVFPRDSLCVSFHSRTVGTCRVTTYDTINSTAVSSSLFENHTTTTTATTITTTTNYYYPGGHLLYVIRTHDES